MIAASVLEKLTTPEEIDAEIEQRRQLISQMVGQLYPSILSDEIDQLQKRKSQLQDTHDTHETHH